MTDTEGRAGHTRPLRRGRPEWVRPSLLVGVAFVVIPLVVGLIGSDFTHASELQVGAYTPNLAPSFAHPLGTDVNGLDYLAELSASIPPSLEIGLIAGAVSSAVGVAVGLLAGYHGGLLDTLGRVMSDVVLGIPALPIFVVLVALIGQTSVPVLALILAVLGWPWTARSIRAQVLSLRERPYVAMSQISGRNSWAVMFLEIGPNLLPWVAQGLVGATSAAILTSVGLQLLGLGQVDKPTLGLMLQNAYEGGALSEGQWWLWVPPAVVLVVLFLGLFLVSLSLDLIANPRLRGVGQRRRGHARRAQSRANDHDARPETADQLPALTSVVQDNDA